MDDFTEINYLSDLIARYPQLNVCSNSISEMYDIIAQSFYDGGKLLLCGNGGSCSDCDHIVGELMKSFVFKRKINEDVKDNLIANGCDNIANKLEGALPAISLCNHNALSSAFINDTDPLLTYAQQVYGYGHEEDTLLAISTSGNAQNCINAVQTARAMGMHTIALTGKTGGTLAQICECAVIVPEKETFKIQELHLPIYHCICAMLEAEFFVK